MAKNRTWYIVVESTNLIGNPIKVNGNLNDLKVTDMNGNEIDTIGIFKSIDLARKISKENFSNRSIYSWREGQKDAWYRDGER